MSTLAELIEKWCQEPPLSRGADPGQLRFETDGGYISIEAREISADVAELSTAWPAPDWLLGRTLTSLPSLAELASDTEQSRFGLLQAQSNTNAIQLTIKVYLDGLSRQSFTLAVFELARAYASLTRFEAEVGARLPELLAGESELSEALVAAEEAEKEAVRSSETAMLPPVEPMVGPPIEQQAFEPAPAAAACTNCGAELAEGARFCIGCGTPVAEAGQACKSCGAALADGAQFCISCGTRVL